MAGRPPTALGVDIHYLPRYLGTYLGSKQGVCDALSRPYTGLGYWTIEHLPRYLGRYLGYIPVQVQVQIQVQATYAQTTLQVKAGT